MERGWGESSARVQPLTVHPHLANGAGQGREFSPVTASDSKPTTTGERSRTGRGFSPGTASDITSTAPGERSRAGEKVLPGYSLRQCIHDTWRTEQHREESSLRVQPLIAHPQQVVNGAGPGREFSPGAASDSTPKTTGERSRAWERGQPKYSLWQYIHDTWRTEQRRGEMSAPMQPMTVHPRHLASGAGPGERSARVQFLTAHPRHLVDKAGPRREEQPLTARKRHLVSGAGPVEILPRVQPLTVHSQHLVSGTGPGRDFARVQPLKAHPRHSLMSEPRPSTGHALT